jgi:hypothetical protein
MLCLLNYWPNCDSTWDVARLNRIPDTGAADKEHKYESATYTLMWIYLRPADNQGLSRCSLPTRDMPVRICGPSALPQELLLRTHFPSFSTVIGGEAASRL